MTKPFHSRTDSSRDDWQTPIEIIESLGSFDLDPCANINNPTRLATVGYTNNGLSLEWSGRIWLNPPYGDEAKDWVRRLSIHGNGIALIVPRTGSRWFQELVFDRADSLLFIEGRISFLNDNLLPVKGNNADSVLVSYGEFNSTVLEVCGIDGKFIRLR